MEKNIQLILTQRARTFTFVFISVIASFLNDVRLQQSYFGTVLMLFLKCFAQEVLVTLSSWLPKPKSGVQCKFMKYRAGGRAERM